MSPACPAAPLLEQLAGVLLDKEQALRLVLAAVLARGHVLVEDLPGVGKTTLALALAKSLGLEGVRVQMTADLLPGDLLGGNFYDPRQQAFVFRAGPLFHGLILVDEINRAPPRTQSALMEAMAEGQVSVDGHSYALPVPFLVIATQNPRESSGVFPLPENQLDRFAVTVTLGYPSRAAEARLLQGEGGQVAQLEPLADALVLQGWQGEVQTVFMSAEVREMVLDLVTASRQDPRLRLGISPRGLLAFQGVARAWAWLSGRDCVLPDDLQAVAVAVLAHRLQAVEEKQEERELARLMQACWGFAP